MAGSYIANDPAGTQAQPIGPSPDRPASGVTFSNLPPEQIYRTSALEQ